MQAKTLVSSNHFLKKVVQAEQQKHSPHSAYNTLNNINALSNGSAANMLLLPRNLTQDDHHPIMAMT